MKEGVTGILDNPAQFLLLGVQPSMLNWFGVPGSARGAGPRGRAGIIAIGRTVTRKALHTALCLVIAATQLTAAAGVPVDRTAGTGGEYFCCCIGECHCTADCCNHAPPELPDNESTRVRIGAGGLVLEAPRSCGTAQGTLQRPHQQDKILAVDLRRGTRLQVDESFASPESAEIPVFESDYSVQSNPRAPPLVVCIA